MYSTKTIRLRLLLLWGIFPLLFLSAPAFSQTEKVSGTIINQRNSAPVPGATITLKGTDRLTVADDAGKFSIDASTGDVLIVTIIGYTKKEIVVGKSKSIEVKLSEVALQLDDVVVIGYGKTRRKDVTGSISSITGDELRKTSPTTFDQALQGKVPGVTIQQISGQPGGGVSIQIHGISSISGSNSPLYVIDGVIIPPINDPGNGANPLNTINPSEIESIDVLKDASAAAIYGSRGANGVIVITTKKSTGGPKIEAGASWGVFAGYLKKYKVMSSSEFRSFTKENNLNFDSSASVDALDEITNDDLSQNYNVGFSGGNENGKFRASFLAGRTQGFLKKTSLDKYLGSFNGQYKFRDSFEFKPHARLVFSANHLPQSK
jgi:TonB-dependent SusC/RagA subfamily outer membrane receptor